MNKTTARKIVTGLQTLGSRGVRVFTDAQHTLLTVERNVSVSEAKRLRSLGWTSYTCHWTFTFVSPERPLSARTTTGMIRSLTKAWSL